MNTPQPPRPGTVLRLHIEGVEELGGDVRLGSFIEKLNALKGALAASAQLKGDGSTSVDFLVSDLRHSSPAMVEITAVPTAKTGSPVEVVDQFLRFVRGVADRTIEATSDNAKLVGQVRSLVAGAGERFERLWLDGPGITPIVLNQAVERALDDALPDVRRELGSIKGVVKRYSGVGKRPYFKVVPPTGHLEIKCIFPIHLLDKAAAAVEHNATVEGELKFYEGDLWPYEVAVRDIVAHPPDDELPTLSSLAGGATNATGDESAVDFVRRLRSEW